MAGLVVVGIDGSEGARRALAWALEEAVLRDARLRVVLAWSYLDQPRERFDPQYGETDARRQLDASIAAVVPDDVPITVEPVVVNDLPARALLDEAPAADLLVVGSRGVGGFKGLLLGSVSQQIAQHAPCPVIIVPGPDRAAATAAETG